MYKYILSIIQKFWLLIWMKQCTWMHRRALNVITCVNYSSIKKLKMNYIYCTDLSCIKKFCLWWFQTESRLCTRKASCRTLHIRTMPSMKSSIGWRHLLLWVISSVFITMMYDYRETGDLQMYLWQGIRKQVLIAYL